MQSCIRALHWLFAITEKLLKKEFFIKKVKFKYMEYNTDFSQTAKKSSSGEDRVYVDGVNVKDYDIEALRNKVGIVMQKAALFKGTIRENMWMGKKGATDEIFKCRKICSRSSRPITPPCAPGWRTPSTHWSSRITGPQEMH